MEPETDGINTPPAETERVIPQPFVVPEEVGGYKPYSAARQFKTPEEAAEYQAVIDKNIEIAYKIVDAINAADKRVFQFEARVYSRLIGQMVVVLVEDRHVKEALNVNILPGGHVFFEGWGLTKRHKAVFDIVRAVHEDTEDDFGDKVFTTPVECGRLGGQTRAQSLGPDGVAQAMASMREVRWKPLHAAVETVIEEEKVLAYAETLTAALERTGVQSHLRKAALKRICDVIINYRRVTTGGGES